MIKIKHYFFIIFYSFALFIFVSISFQPFSGCCLHDTYPETRTCWKMSAIQEAMVDELISQERTSFKFTKETFLSVVEKKDKKFFLDGWGNKIIFKEEENGYRLISNVDKNQSDWVRQVHYENIKGEDSGCYVDKGLIEQFFCTH